MTLAYDYAIDLIARHDDCLISAAIDGPTVRVAAVELARRDGRALAPADIARIANPTRSRILERLALTSCETTLHP